jgi:hypothetical protein
MREQDKNREKDTSVFPIADWLLAAATPSVRYLTLRRLLGRPEGDQEVMAAWRAMKTCGPIPAILAEQTEAGHWAGERSYYTPKYTSTHWSMLLLAELAADGADLRFRQGTAFMLSATANDLQDDPHTARHGYPCFWGNVLRYALRGGFWDDARVQEMIHTLVGQGLEAGWRCPINDDLPCAWGVARALWGFAAIPGEQRTSQVKAAVQEGVAWLLEVYDLVEANYPSSGRVHPLWFRLNFPLFYQADILFVLRVLAELEALDHPGARPALEWLAARRKSNGRWRGASPFRRRTWAALADREEADRWVTLQAAVVLQKAGA